MALVLRFYGCFSFHDYLLGKIDLVLLSQNIIGQNRGVLYNNSASFKNNTGRNMVSVRLIGPNSKFKGASKSMVIPKTFHNILFLLTIPKLMEY